MAWGAKTAARDQEDLMAVHETAEEMVVYPALRAEGDDGHRVVESRMAEKDEAKKVPADLGDRRPAAGPHGISPQGSEGIATPLAEHGVCPCRRRTSTRSMRLPLRRN